MIVAALATEAHSGAAQAALAEIREGEAAISSWVITEFSAAVSIKARLGAIDGVGRAKLLGKFASYRADVWSVYPVDNRHFLAAAALADHPGTGLRAGDALHLAVAIEHDAEVWTLDRKFAEAGTKLGYAVRLI